MAKKVKKNLDKDLQMIMGEDYDVTNITTGFHMTVNLGDYESAKILKGISISPKKDNATEEEIEAMLNSAKKFIRKKVIEEVKETLHMREVV